MELSFYTYGYIDAMFYTLNAIAMLFNSNLGKSILTFVVSISTAYYAVRMSYSGNDFKIHLGKSIGMILMIVVLISPRTDVIIHDTITKKKEKVDNLPVGFAFPVAVLETFGYWLTVSFEQAFSGVSSTNYTEYGMVFGARLVQESRNWRIRTPEFMENMSNFINRCVMIDSMIGYHYTPEDMMQSDDVWRLVSENAATLRKAPMRVKKDRVLMSCKDAAKSVIEPAFKLEINAIGGKYEKSDMARAGLERYIPGNLGVLNANFKKNVETAFKGYVGTSVGAEQLIRQQMMINSIKGYMDQYGYARATATQESNWRIAGDLAGTYLPILMAVLKCLVYSSFVFMLPLLLISGGWGRYLSYLSIVLSFQLWGPLNAVLNMFIDIYSSTSLSGIADNIISFSTMSRIGNYTDKIVAVASGLQMSIPFLAFGIIQGGVGSFIHLAGNITGASQAAASQAANESTTGNKSFDNYSVGNKQLYNQNGFKTDWNQSYASGASSKQMMDGSMERVTGTGNTLIQSGVGFSASSGATSYKLDDSRQAQMTESIQAAESLHSQDLRSAATAESNHLAKSADYISHIAQREHDGETFNYETMGEQGQALQRAVNHAKQLHDNNNYDWRQSGIAAAEVSASIGLKPFGIGGGATLTGTTSAENSNSQGVGINNSINKDDSISDSNNNLIKAMSNSSWARENSIDTGYSDSVRGSREELQRAEQQASLSKQRVDDYHQAKAIVDSQGATSSREMYQEVVDGIKQGYGVDAHTAQRMADQRSPEAQKVWQQIRNSDPYVKNVISSINSGRSEVTGAQASEKLEQFTADNRIHSNVVEKVKEHSIVQGLNPNDLKGNIQNAKNDLKETHGKLISENAAQHRIANDTKKAQESKLQRQMNRYEDNRLSKVIGIGGSDKSNKSNLLNHKDYEKANNQ
jgi:hypothetical protein